MTMNFTLNGHPIHSLKDVRDYFNADEIRTAHSTGALYNWLIENYYETEAEQIKTVSPDDRNRLEKICKILNVPMEIYQTLTEAEKQELYAKRERLRKYTQDEEILQNVLLVAFGQEDLVKLLNTNQTKIYLCENEFSIPLSKSGITYIGIGNVVISHAFTRLQYQKAGIHIENIILPEKENPDTSDFARTIAVKNGYDEYGDFHSPLATTFHKELKFIKIPVFYHLDYHSSLAGKYFNSRSECEHARTNCITRLYQECNNYFSPQSSKCVAKKAAEVYAKCISDEFENSIDLLQKVFEMAHQKKEYERLKSLVTDCYKYLLEQFQQELHENASYYAMYDLDYFIEQAAIEKFDGRVEEGFFKIFETLFTDSIQYHITNLLSSIQEMEKDLNEHASTFFNTAFSIYKDYVAKIEALIHNASKDLPDMRPGERALEYLQRI